MAITPLAGWKIDPLNPNQVIREDVSITPTPTPAPTQPVSSVDLNKISPALISPQEKPFDLTGTIKELDIVAAAKAPTIADIQADPLAQEKQRQLNEINQRIRMHDISAMESQEKALVSGITTAFGAGEAQRIARNEVFEGMRMAAIADTIRGDFSLAESRSERALNIKYEASKSRIQELRRSIIANYDSFTDAQKKIADQRLLELDSKDAFVAAQREKDKQTFDVVKDAISKAGSLGTTISNTDIIKALKSAPEEAMSIMAPYQVKKVAEKKIQPIKESIVDIRQRKKDLADLLEQVTSYTTRDEAINELNRYQGSILEKVKQEGMDKLKVEIDRLFPPLKEEIPKEEKIGKLGEVFGEIKGFFSRLFGK